MTTALQAQSNARNARQSTGPASPEGTARVARNAVKHGFCAADILMPGDDAAAFARLVQRQRELWQPADEEEQELVDEIAVARWRRWRLRRAEAELWAVRCAVPAGDGGAPIARDADVDAARIVSLGEAIAQDCDSAANAIEKVRRWWQGNERHLNRCEERLRLMQRLASMGIPRRSQAGKAPGIARMTDALIHRPLPGETPQTVEREFRKFAEQTQTAQPEPDQGDAPAGAAAQPPVSHDHAPAHNAPRNRKERRRLERQQRKAEYRAQGAP